MSPARSFIKICGITNVADARVVVAAGADALGLIFAASPRSVTLHDAQEISQAVEGAILRCAVFRGLADGDVLRHLDEVEVDVVQLHDPLSTPLLRALRERGLFVMKALAIDGPEFATYNDGAVDAVLVDGPRPGSGTAHSWEALASRRFSAALVAAGGLTRENVATTIDATKAWGVDCASGVERAPGRKDADLVYDFVARARQAFEEREGT